MKCTNCLISATSSSKSVVLENETRKAFCKKRMTLLRLWHGRTLGYKVPPSKTFGFVVNAKIIQRDTATIPHDDIEAAFTVDTL